MSAGTARQRKLFDFLKRQGGQSFELSALVKATGYKSASAERSLGEHWASVVQTVRGKSPRRWKTLRAFETMNLDGFLDAISQSKRSRRNKLDDPRVAKLVHLCKANALLALETLNRIGCESRVESFLLLFVNAWELLLKAEKAKLSGWDALFLPDRKTKGGRRRTVSFETLVEALPASSLADRARKQQLLDLYELRNEAAHLVLSRPSREHLHLFAGALRSLSQRYSQLVGESLVEASDVAGFLVLVGLSESVTMQGSTIAFGEAATSPGADAIRANIDRYGNDYAIPLTIRLMAIEEELASQAVASTEMVLKPSATAVRERFRFKRDEVARRVSAQLATQGLPSDFRAHHVDLVREKEGWRESQENPYVTQFTAAKLYSDQAIERIVELIQKRRDYVEVAANQRKRRTRKRQRRANR